MKSDKRDYGNVDVEWYDVWAAVTHSELTSWMEWIRQGLREHWKPRR